MRRRWKAPPCGSGKAAFRTRGQAIRALDRIAKDNAQAAAPGWYAPQREYQCECGAWHLTKKLARAEARHA